MTTIINKRERLKMWIKTDHAQQIVICGGVVGFGEYIITLYYEDIVSKFCIYDINGNRYTVANKSNVGTWLEAVDALFGLVELDKFSKVR